MGRLRVLNFSVSVDGFGAGPEQSVEQPIGVGGTRLHEWAYATRWFHRMTRQEGGESGPDEDFMVRGEQGIGATIMGRNMFGPVRGAWPDESWRGWWGDEPPYHHPVFVLTHHPRAPLEMAGGTTFHFVTDGIESALAQARAAAGDLDVRLGGGVSTVRAYLDAGLVDELHLVVAPVLLGRGERLFEGLASDLQGYECVEFAASKAVAHVRFERTS